MTLELAWQLALNGLEDGAVYALLACGLVIAYRAAGFLHLAHAPTAMLAAFAFASLGGPLGVVPAALVAIVAAGALGLGLHLAVFARVRNAPFAAKVTVSLATAIGLQALGGAIYVASGLLDRRAGPLLPETVRIDLGAGASLTAQALALPVVALVVLLALAWVVARTDLGLALRATAQNPLAASLAGVPARAVEAGAWLVVGGLAGLVGVLTVSSTAFLIPTFLVGESTRAFVAALVGGFSDLRRTVVAAFAIGVLEQELVGAPAPWDVLSGAVAFAVLLASVTFGIGRRGLVVERSE